MFALYQISASTRKGVFEVNVWVFSKGPGWGEGVLFLGFRNLVTLLLNPFWEPSAPIWKCVVHDTNVNQFFYDVAICISCWGHKQDQNKSSGISQNYCSYRLYTCSLYEAETPTLWCWNSPRLQLYLFSPTVKLFQRERWALETMTCTSWIDQFYPNKYVSTCKSNERALFLLSSLSGGCFLFVCCFLS